MPYIIPVWWHASQIRTLPVPTIAAINGAAVGGGMCFAMACDVRMASTSAKMGFNFVRLVSCKGGLNKP